MGYKLDTKINIKSVVKLVNLTSLAGMTQKIINSVIFDFILITARMFGILF